MDLYAISTGAFALTTVAATWKWVSACIHLDTAKYTEELLHEDIADLRADNTRLNGLIDEMDATHALDLMAADNRAKKQDDLIRKQGREIAEFRAVRAKQCQGGARGRATQTARRLAREADAKATSDALHADMQANVDAATAILDRKAAA